MVWLLLLFTWLFHCPRKNSEKQATLSSTLGNPPYRYNFSQNEQNAKSSHEASVVSRMSIIKVQNKFSNIKVPESNRNDQTLVKFILHNKSYHNYKNSDYFRVTRWWRTYSGAITLTWGNVASGQQMIMWKSHGNACSETTIITEYLTDPGSCQHTMELCKMFYTGSADARWKQPFYKSVSKSTRRLLAKFRLFLTGRKNIILLQGVPKKVSIKNFYSDLFTASINNFEFIWTQYICKFCLVYHLIDLDASR